MMGLTARHGAAGQLEVLRALDHASFVFLSSLGTSGRPRFELIIECDDETWARLIPHSADIVRHLEDISSVAWSLRRTRPLVINGLDGKPFELSRQGVSAALAEAGEAEAAMLAQRAAGFEVRPRPGGGRHIVTVHDPDVLAEDEMRTIDEAIFRGLPSRTSWAHSPGFEALARRLAPQPTEGRLVHVGVITSSGGAMRADTLGHLDVFETTTRVVRVNSPDAPSRLAETLAAFWNSAPPPDAVLIARGGGDPDDLDRLGTPEVRKEVERLRNRGTFVVAAIGHGNSHVDLGADVHARTPTSGAEIIRRKFHDAPEAQRLAYANHEARIAGLRFDGGDEPLRAAHALVAQLQHIEDETAVIVDRHRQPEQPIQGF